MPNFLEHCQNCGYTSKIRSLLGVGHHHISLQKFGFKNRIGPFPAPTIDEMDRAVISWNYYGATPGQNGSSGQKSPRSGTSGTAQIGKKSFSGNTSSTMRVLWAEPPSGAALTSRRRGAAGCRLGALEPRCFCFVGRVPRALRMVER
jgi:hypothetical protein